MSNFVRFMSGSHLNGINLAMYDGQHGAVLQAERVPGGKALGTRAFASRDDAEIWYESRPGTGLGRLANAVEEIAG